MPVSHLSGAHGGFPAVLLLSEPFRRRGKGGSEPALSDSAGGQTLCRPGQICAVVSAVRSGGSAGFGHDAPGQPGFPLEMVSGFQMEPGADFLQFSFLWNHEPGHVSAAVQNGVSAGKGLGVLCAGGAHLPDFCGEPEISAVFSYGRACGGIWRHLHICGALPGGPPVGLAAPGRF